MTKLGPWPKANIPREGIYSILLARKFWFLTDMPRKVVLTGNSLTQWHFQGNRDRIIKFLSPRVDKEARHRNRGGQEQITMLEHWAWFSFSPTFYILLRLGLSQTFTKNNISLIPIRGWRVYHYWSHILTGLGNTRNLLILYLLLGSTW